MDLSGVSVDTILARDTKLFTLMGKTVQIAQVMVPSFAWNRERDTGIHSELEKARAASGANLSLALFTNVLENASDLYGADDAALISGLFGETLPVRLPGVMSRKKDFLPWLGEKLRSWAGRDALRCLLRLYPILRNGYEFRGTDSPRGAIFGSGGTHRNMQKGCLAGCLPMQITAFVGSGDNRALPQLINSARSPMFPW